MNSGMKMRDARLNAGLTLKQLSKLSGVSLSSLSAYERGSRKPKIETAAMIAPFLGLAPGDLSEIPRWAEKYDDQIVSIVLKAYMQQESTNKDDKSDNVLFAMLHDLLQLELHREPKDNDIREEIVRMLPDIYDRLSKLPNFGKGKALDRSNRQDVIQTVSEIAEQRILNSDMRLVQTEFPQIEQIKSELDSISVQLRDLLGGFIDKTREDREREIEVSREKLQRLFNEFDSKLRDIIES